MKALKAAKAADKEAVKLRDLLEAGCEAPWYELKLCALVTVGAERQRAGCHWDLHLLTRRCSWSRDVANVDESGSPTTRRL